MASGSAALLAHLYGLWAFRIGAEVLAAAAQFPPKRRSEANALLVVLAVEQRRWADVMDALFALEAELRNTSAAELSESGRLDEVASYVDRLGGKLDHTQLEQAYQLLGRPLGG